MKKSICSYFNLGLKVKKRLDTIKSVGYDQIFISLFDQKDDISWQEQVKYAKEIGLDITMVHCNYYGLKLEDFWFDNKNGERVVLEYIKQIEKCHDVSKNFVIHLNSKYESAPSLIGLKRIKQILQVCEKYDINLCIENTHFDWEIPFIFDNIFHKNLKICLDFGHQNYQCPNLDIIKKYAKKIQVVHLHDNNGQEDQHLTVGEGNINWLKIAQSLKNVPDLVLSSEFKFRNVELTNYKEKLEKDYKNLCQLEKMIQYAKQSYKDVIK